MPEKKTKEQSKNEIAAIFDQLLANTCKPSGDEGSLNESNIAEEIEQDIKEEPETQKLVLEGRSEITKGHFAAALKFFNQALELDPQCWDAWSAMGDALMEMGKIDQASICYKKAMASTFGLGVDPLNNDESGSETKETDWQDYLMSFVETKKDSPEKRTPEVEERASIPKKPQTDSEGLDTDSEDIFKVKEEKKDQNQKEAVHFPCPSCGSDVELDSGMCSKCQIMFTEERFENYEPMDDDIAFFGRIKALLGKEERFFIHFNGEDGSIRFLDKKEMSKTKKPSYIFVSANIEQLGFNYSTSSPKRAESKDMEAKIEED